MKILIIGANGQLGTDLCKVFQIFEVIPLAHTDIEITDVDSIEKVFNKYKPNVVINAASYIRVDDCELQPEKAFLVNAIGAKNVAFATRDLKAMLIYISTDYVFDGEKRQPYTEEDTPNPINTYGISKLAGEYYTKLAEKYYIFRISSLFGAAGARGKRGNFVDTMIKKEKNKEKISVVDNIIMSPTYTKDTARIIRKIIEKNLPYGVYHTSNSGFCSWYAFTKMIFEILNLNIELKPIKTQDLTLRAKRPIFSALESEKLPKYNLKMPEWQEALKEYILEKGYL